MLIDCPDICEKVRYSFPFLTVSAAGGRETETDRDRDAGDRKEGEGAHLHHQTPRRGRGVQGPGHRRRKQVRVHYTSCRGPQSTCELKYMYYGQLAHAEERKLSICICNFQF